jgi:hypothetical protein
LGLRDVAARLGVARVTAKRWWLEGRLIGRSSVGKTQSRIVIPVEVVDFYLRYFRLPTKLELFETGVLTREFLLELSGPDGGLRELASTERVVEPAA